MANASTTPAAAAPTAAKNGGISAETNAQASMEPQESSANKSPQATNNDKPKTLDDTTRETLYRLTEGIPNTELQLIISEAEICEKALMQEIEQLEKELKNPSTKEDKTVTAMIESEFTPPDSHFTVSALLGRLRGPLAMPLPPNSTLPAYRKQQQLLRESQSSSTSQPQHKKKKTSKSNTNTTKPEIITLQQVQQQISLYHHPEYKRQRESSQLLSVWKKISTHRTSLVFRKPVSSKDAPGYEDRIFYPIDLSFIRKMIVGKFVQSYSDLHVRIGLICHNCLKYNGRESDYGIVTRDFEAMVDDTILQAVVNEVARK